MDVKNGSDALTRIISIRILRKQAIWPFIRLEHVVNRLGLKNQQKQRSEINFLG